MLIIKIFRDEDPSSYMSCHNDASHQIRVGDEYGEDENGRLFCSTCAKPLIGLSACASARYWKTEDKKS